MFGSSSTTSRVASGSCAVMPRSWPRIPGSSLDATRTRRRPGISDARPPRRYRRTVTFVLTVVQNAPDVPLDRLEGWAPGRDPPRRPRRPGRDPSRRGRARRRPRRARRAPERVRRRGGPLAARAARAARRRLPLRRPDARHLPGRPAARRRARRPVQVAAPPGTEAGVVPIFWRPEAVSDAVVGPLVAGLLRAARHAAADAALRRGRRPAAGAVWLASSNQYPYQAFRIGSAWGVQFHPEASTTTLRDWADVGRRRRHRRDPRRVRRARGGARRDRRDAGRRLRRPRACQRPRSASTPEPQPSSGVHLGDLSRPRRATGA